MTVGIYALVFTDYEPFYIGQSVNIEKRYKEHLYAMARGDCNSKLKYAYKIYGIPELFIVEECMPSALDELELYYITSLNSVADGLNEWSGPIEVCRGEKPPNSKHTDSELLEIIKLLSNTPALPFIDIHRVTGVSRSTIENVSSGKVGSHLRDVVPEEYMLMELNRGTRKSIASSARGRGIVYPTILSPSGDEYNIENVTKFAKEHGLNMSHVCSVLNRIRKSHKGWRLK